MRKRTLSSLCFGWPLVSSRTPDCRHPRTTPVSANGPRPSAGDVLSVAVVAAVDAVSPRFFPVAPNPHPPVCSRCLRAIFPMARHPLHILCRLRFPVARDPYPTTRAPFPVTWRPHHVASRPRGPDLYPRGWWHHRIFNGSDTMPGPELDFYTSRRRGLLGACYGPWMERAAGDHDDARRGYGKNEPSHRLFLSSWNVYV